MSDERKKEKTRREDYYPLEAKSKPRKALVFGKKSKEKRKKGKEIEERGPSPPANPFNGERGVFGVPLAVAVSRMRSHDGVPLPVVIRQCIDYVNEHGLEVEGIYRISAPKSRLDGLENVANSRRPVPLSDVHDAAGLLKRFLRQLPHSVLTDEMRSTFEKIAAECPCRSLPACRCLVADLLKAQLSKLPPENYTLLAYVFVHAQQIVAHRNRNKMSIAALGLLLQATLNISQQLLRIFLTNASDKLNEDDKCPCRSLPACRCLVADLLKAQLSKLPPENYTLLAYVFVHAQQIVAHRNRNKMSIAALGLLLQATLNISQQLLRIFLTNASDKLNEDDSASIVYLFRDVQIKSNIQISLFFPPLQCFKEALRSDLGR
ncbi:RalA-binding protein 1 [Toxocara canis]|uniref:RalA-binding protein 1 n=1 Tax=Toxocara canis TaxID=6265 RepID=A0A0B2UNR9_TOXCA|nr:RalA-binding protein 1 [Toxocara canis]